MSITLKFRGQTKILEEIPEMLIIPMIKALGTEKAPEQGTAAYADWTKRFLERFTDPSALAAVAYSLKAIWPELPPEYVKYDLYQSQGGEQRIDFRLAMTADEFLQLIQPIEKALAKDNAGLKAVSKPKPKGFAASVKEATPLEPEEEVDVDVEERRSQLLQELADLDTVAG